MPNVYIYVVARDLGFAPNPFHGVCTLATCKPGIRNTAAVGDWIFGVGGTRLRAVGCLVFAMKVTQKMTFNDYWLSDQFKSKKPIRNGSKKTMLGDNIYFQKDDSIWQQAHSHHSLDDGSLNEYNLKRDTQSKNVLISKHFYYFGSSAPAIPAEILTELNYRNIHGHRKFSLLLASKLVEWLENSYSTSLNRVSADPFDFDKSEAHYSVETNKMT